MPTPTLLGPPVAAPPVPQPLPTSTIKSAATPPKPALIGGGFRSPPTYQDPGAIRRSYSGMLGRLLRNKFSRGNAYAHGRPNTNPVWGVRGDPRMYRNFLIGGGGNA